MARRLRNRRPSSSQTCSMGVRSGDNAGHSIRLTLFCCRKSMVIRATCGLALSCWSMTSRRWFMKGITTGSKTSWMLTLSIQCSTNNNQLELLCGRYSSPYHNSTLKRFNWCTQLSAKRSPVRRYTRTLPSLLLRVNRDSSLKVTLDHCCRAQPRWLRSQSLCAKRWRCARTGPTYCRLARTLHHGYMYAPVAYG